MDIDKAYKQAKYQLEVEGFTLTEEDEKVMKGFFEGKITRKQIIEDLKRGENNE